MTNLKRFRINLKHLNDLMVDLRGVPEDVSTKLDTMFNNLAAAENACNEAWELAKHHDWKHRE